MKRAQPPIPTDVKGPMSLWQKVKTGVKGFFTSVGEYLPRGLLFSGLLLGGSYLLGVVGGPGWDLLSVGANAAASPMNIVKHVATSMVIGSLISGTVGAWQSISQESDARERQVLAQEGALERLKSRSRGLEQGADIAAHTMVPHHGLPTEVAKTVATHVPGV